jgi:hypothetical protein
MGLDRSWYPGPTVDPYSGKMPRPLFVWVYCNCFRSVLTGGGNAAALFCIYNGLGGGGAAPEVFPIELLTSGGELWYECREGESVTFKNCC